MKSPISPPYYFLAFYGCSNLNTHIYRFNHLWQRIGGIHLYGAGLPHSVWGVPAPFTNLRMSFVFTAAQCHLVYMYLPYVHCSFISCWTYRLFPLPSYCEQSSNKQERECICARIESLLEICPGVVQVHRSVGMLLTLWRTTILIYIVATPLCTPTNSDYKLRFLM